MNPFAAALLILAATSPTWISLVLRARGWKRQGMTAADWEDARRADLYSEGSA